MNFNIQNKIADVTEIDIFGDIGASWFGEGITFESVREQLKNITTPKIKLNISSLGGSVNDALIIYNLLKTNGATIEANIMGFTASSATIIAMAGDTISMDENASFLIHNAWTGVSGNQHDLRDVADELETIDNKLASIYRDKTGLRRDTILNLMKEERWLSSKEAKEMGFVDKVYKPMKAAAHYNKEIEIINASNLPTIMTETQMQELKSSFMTDVKDYVLNFFKEKENNVSETDVKNAVESAMADKFKEFEAKNVELMNRISELESENEALKVKPTEVENKQEPNPTSSEPTQVNAWDKFAQELRNKLPKIN